MILAVTHVSDAAARLDRLPVSSFHRRTAALLAYVFFFELGDLNSFAYAAPALRQQWDLSIGTIATITSASFVGMFVGAMSAGTLSDHIGRKRALIATTVWYSTMSLFNAFAWSVPSLFAARLLTGVGLSGMTVVAMTYIGEMFPSRPRRLPGAHPDRSHRHPAGLRRAVPDSVRRLGMARRIHLGIARAVLPAVRAAPRGVAAMA
jgi:putative MFS transporter